MAIHLPVFTRSRIDRRVLFEEECVVREVRDTPVWLYKRGDGHGLWKLLSGYALLPPSEAFEEARRQGVEVLMGTRINPKMVVVSTLHTRECHFGDEDYRRRSRMSINPEHSVGQCTLLPIRQTVFRRPNSQLR